MSTDLRALLNGAVERISDCSPHGQGGAALYELVVDALLHIGASAGTTALALNTDKNHIKKLLQLKPS